MVYRLPIHWVSLFPAVVFFGTLGAAVAQIADNPDTDGLTSLVENQRALVDVFGSFDWQKEYPAIERALDNVWRGNAWKDEADRFAHDLVREVSAIPPWQFFDRFNLMSSRVAERYQFSSDQQARFQALLLRESAGLFTRNAEVVFRQTREILRVRSRGAAFTSEQITRWTRESEPLFLDARARADQMIAELRNTLTPEQQQIFDRDVTSYRKRLSHLEGMRGRWARGQWQAEDWGMQDDPIQRRAGADQNAGSTAEGMSTDRPDSASSVIIPRHWAAHDPSTWIAFVLDFQKRFQLDPGQVTAAESIHVELLDRAITYTQTYAESLGRVPLADRDRDDRFEPVRRLFQELQDRLNALPSTTQREQAGSLR